MFLFNSLNLLLDGRRGDGEGTGDSGTNVFPEGTLTSAAWEGWWHEDT